MLDKLYRKLHMGTIRADIVESFIFNLVIGLILFMGFSRQEY